MMNAEEIIKDIGRSKNHPGKKEYIKFLRGERITPRERILAQCYDCMGYFSDGYQDCGITTCPLYGVGMGKKNIDKIDE